MAAHSSAIIKSRRIRENERVFCGKPFNPYSGLDPMPQAVSTQVLVEKAQQGDSNSLNELCDRYLPRVLAAVRIRLGAKLRRKIQSMDVVQSAMMDALKEVESFDYRTEGAFMKFLNRVVENKIRNKAEFFGAQKRDINREAELPDAANLVKGDPNTPSQIVRLNEEFTLLERAMDQLAEVSKEYRDLIVAIKLEGRSYDEVAEELGATRDAVRMKFKRAFVALTRIFQQIEKDQK